MSLQIEHRGDGSLPIVTFLHYQDGHRRIMDILKLFDKGQSEKIQNMLLLLFYSKKCIGPKVVPRTW